MTSPAERFVTTVFIQYSGPTAYPLQKPPRQHDRLLATRRIEKRRTPPATATTTRCLQGPEMPAPLLRLKIRHIFTEDRMTYTTTTISKAISPCSMMGVFILQRHIYPLRNNCSLSIVPPPLMMFCDGSKSKIISFRQYPAKVDEIQYGE